MLRFTSFELISLLVAGILAFAVPAANAAEEAPVPTSPSNFRIKLDSTAVSKPYTGRVWVILSQNERREPRQTVSWMTKSPIYAMDVKDWKPGETLNFAASDIYGAQAKNLPEGMWNAQAVINLRQITHDVINAPGNAHSEVVSFHWPRESGSEPPLLVIDQKIPEWDLKDSDDRKFVTLRSKLLSDFHGKDWDMRAAVMPPQDYDPANKSKQYPTVYTVGGMGTDIRARYWMSSRDMLAAHGMDAFVVFIDADCPTGHHVFADSANNGPVGTALVEEMIPHLEKTFNMIPQTAARYVTGHSSGGWSSLWLQITYPEVFGGCWSTSPDPVDFSAFQTVNIYEDGANMFVDREGKERPISRPMGRGQLMTRSFGELEEILGRGGQLQSFEAVFSPRGDDGQPQKLWDRKTGAIDSKVAEAWKKYDIHLLLKQNWSEREPALRGKLHLFCGDQDTFYLDGAFMKLAAFLREISSDAHVEVVAGAGHSLPPQIFAKCYEQMAAKWHRAQKLERD
ncbi:MAG: alpha/beta hydrolase-fold protein [Phycisphaerae bacterium]